MTDDPLLGEELTYHLRELATAAEPDTIAVIVLAGTPERGLGLSVSSQLDTQETIRLMLVSALDDAAMQVVQQHLPPPAP